ncbi:BspA family leucine-rich repeat surface protein [Pseudactinotalea terrae]|uniref:BspA family leucine-rich repeat surface protein n=1 Tax=Pseudactinotalea terrae TaxID=1743262 RepID=UPI0012E14F7A|nr:BspA family leucine-rich repeat surface protein [Pseudactinotalea terrae]
MGRLTRALSDRSRGFTLAELLVTIVIIAVVAAIAVPFFMNQRDKGYDAAARSDLKNAATLAAANYDPMGLGYASEQVFADRNGELLSDGGTYIGYADIDSYVLYGQSRSGRLFMISSTNGGVPVAVAAEAPDVGDVVLATAGLGAVLAAAGGGGIADLPGLTDTPPVGIERPYAAVAWGEGEGGQQERESEFFPADAPAPGDGDGGPIVIPAVSALVYDTTLPSCPAATTRTLHVPALGSDYAIDWGDGIVTENTNTHTYAEAGRYTITLTGTIEHFGGDYDLTSHDQSPYALDGNCLEEVVSYNAPDLGTVSLRGAFYYGTNLRSLGPLDTTGVTDMGLMFALTTALNEPLDLDTSSVTRMDSMFYKTRAFNQPVDFDTSNVTTMKWMFSGARAFNQPVAFETGQVSDMDGMFFDARVFSQDLSGWDVSAHPTMPTSFANGAMLTTEQLPPAWR